MTEVQCPLPSRVATTHGAWTLPFLPLSLRTVASHHTNHWHNAFGKFLLFWLTVGSHNCMYIWNFFFTLLLSARSQIIVGLTSPGTRIL